MANDFSLMSDDELQRNIASASAPAQPAVKDFSSMSDSDLENAIKGAPAQPTRVDPPLPAGLSADMPQPRLSGNVLNRPAPPVPDMPVDSGMRARPSILSPSDDAELNSVMDMPIVRPSPARAAVQSVADFVSPGMEMAGRMGLDLPAARAAAQQTGQGNRAIGPDIAAMMSGGLNLTDSVMGFAPGLIQQAAGVPQAQRRVVNDQGAFNQLPLVQEMRNRAPQQFDQMAQITPMVAPQPSAGIISGPGVMRAVGNTALNTGGISSLLYGADQAKHGQDITPQGLAGSFAAGAAGGALVHGGVAATAALPGIAKSIANTVVKSFSKLSPEQQKMVTAAAAAQPNVEQFAQNIGAQNLPEGTQQMIAATRAPQPVPQVIPAPPAIPAPPRAESIPTNKLQGRVDAVGGPRVVTVNGEYVPLEGGMLKRYEEAEGLYKSRVESIKDYHNRGLIFGDERGKALKAAGMRFAAEARQITGKLTAREQSKAAEDAAKIRSGDWVSFKGEPAKVLRNPAYGRVMIEHNGAQVHADYYDLTKIDPPKVKPRISLTREQSQSGLRDFSQFTDSQLEQAVKDVDTSTQDNLSSPLEAKIERTVNAATPVQAAAAVEQWAEDLTGKPVDLSAPIEGDFRRTITPTNWGRNKNKVAEPLTGHPIYDTPDMQHHVGMLAEAKVNKDYNDAVLNKFRRDAWIKFADQDANEFKFPNGAKITKLQGKRSLTAELQNELDSKRDEMSTELAPTKSPVIESLMTQKFGKGANDAHVQYERVPDNRTEAGELYKDIYDRSKDAEKAYDALKPSTIRAELAKAEASAKPDPEKIAHLHELMIERSKMESTFIDMESKIQAHKNDVTAPMHTSTMVPHPLGEQFPPVEVGVMYKKGAMEKVIPQEMQQAWEEAKAEIEGRDSNRQPTMQLGTNMRSVKQAALAALAGAFTQVKAEAANITSKAVAANTDLIHLWNSTPVNEVMIGWILLHKIMPAIARSIADTDGKLFKGAFLWNDTMDHFHHGQQIADKIQAPANQLSLFPKPVRPLEAEFWNTSGQVQQATRGITFDENLKQQAMNELRNGDVTPLEMINGVKGASVTMTPPQRNALAMWKIGQDHLKGLVEDRIQLLRNFKATNPDLDHFSLNRTIEAHQYVLDQFDGAGTRGNVLDKAANKILSNWMDGQFFFNPDFHGTNLFDQLFAVAPAVGSRNIWKANSLLAGDKEIRALMHESNLAGGLKVDRVKAAVAAGKRKASFLDKDIESDLYNANAAWVAGTLKYAQNHEKELAGIGFSGSDSDFVKQVLQGKIDPSITMDVWATNAQLLSRTLGSDVYQVNTNVLNRSGIVKALAIFVRQPARVSRLAMHYLATGNFVALYTFLGYTLAVGGRSAIPDDIQGLYGLTNADSAYKAAAAADSLDIYSKVMGNKLTSKVNYSILWGLSAGANPLANIKEDIGKGANAFVSRDPKGMLKAAGTLAPAAVPRLKGIPVGETMRIANAIITAAKGKRKLFATEFGVIPGGSKEIRMDNYDKARFLAEPFLPGKDPAQDAYNQSVNEKFARGHDLAGLLGINNKVGQDNQYYNRDGGNLLQHGYTNPPDPLGSLFKRKK